MTKRLRVLCMVIFSLIICTGTVSAYTGGEKSVRVIDLNLDEKYETSTETVGELLEEIGITIKNKDTVSKELDAPLKSGDTIEITRSFPVTLEIDGVPRMVYTSKKTVGEVIEENKDDIGTNFELQSATNATKTSSKMTISIKTIKDELSVEIQEIPYETVRVENDHLTIGFEQVAQEGVNGQVQITLKNTYEGTEIVDSTEAGRVVIQPAVDEIIEVGTREVPTIDGYAYTEAVTVTATGYTQFDEGCNGTTATGTAATKGAIAVDTSVFPFGTKFYIPGYGVGVAEDRGGAIKGNKIDLCYDSQAEAFQWGRRTLEVYILE